MGTYFNKYPLLVASSAALLTHAGAVHAGGLDRTGQSLSPLFEKGRYLSLEVQHTRPSVHGVDVRGQSTGNVLANYAHWGFAYKQDITPRLSAAVLLTRPFGLSLDYGDAHNALVSGTYAALKTQELMGIGRYRWNARWATHAGLRIQQSQGSTRLDGPGYGPLNGYQVQFHKSTEPGYVLGLTYERPEMALRVAATYYSAITHKVKTQENTLPFTSTRTTSQSPQSFNLDLQTGVSARSLVFGQIRWAEWEALQLRPLAFTTATKGGSLTDLSNTWTYTLGAAHKFNAMWSAFFSVAYEKRSKGKLLSPLQPSTGRVGYTVGLPWEHQGVKVVPWLSYQRLGDVQIGRGAAPIATFSNSKAVAAGIHLGLRF